MVSFQERGQGQQEKEEEEGRRFFSEMQISRIRSTNCLHTLTIEGSVILKKMNKKSDFLYF